MYIYYFPSTLGSTVNKCKLEFLETPDKNRDDLALATEVNSTFVLEAGCRPQYRFQLQAKNGTFIDLNTEYYRVDERLTFAVLHSSSESDKDRVKNRSVKKYTVTLVINPFTSHYSGQYKFIIQDASDLSNTKEYTFGMSGELLQVIILSFIQ